MTEVIKPHSLDELRDAVAGSVADGATLEVLGLGSKRALGRPLQTARVLDLSALSGVRSYEPAELVLTAVAATPLAEIEQMLADKNQLLAFEPPNFGPLYGTASAGTLGGAIAANLGGPRRIKSGAARDHFLGVAAVSGRGEIFRAGGKVVKNVTGYDLCKLLAGSYGTLAAMEEVTVKVLPAPAKTRTVILFGLTPVTATAAMADALNSPYEVSGAAYLPKAVAERSSVDFVRQAGTAITALRVEGTPVSVAARCKALCARLSYLAGFEELHTMNSGKLWREIRDVAALLPDSGKAIWRVSVPPNAGAAIAAAMKADYFMDWGGGQVWLATDPAGDGGASVLRAALKGAGHATLMRAPLATRAAAPVFEPQDAALAALTGRVKVSFDPKRILNPGRMYAGV